MTITEHNPAAYRFEQSCDLEPHRADIIAEQNSADVRTRVAATAAKVERTIPPAFLEDNGREVEFPTRGKLRVLVACKHGEVRDVCDRCAARRAYIAEWRRNNADKVRSYGQKWLAANPEKRAEAVASWRERNPDKVAEMSSKAGAKWSRANNGQRNALTSFTRAKRKGGFVPWADREKIKAFYIEAARITEETGVPHEVDHIMPLQGELISGLHVHGNLQVVTRFENRSKGKKVAL